MLSSVLAVWAMVCANHSLQSYFFFTVIFKRFDYTFSQVQDKNITVREKNIVT